MRAASARGILITYESRKGFYNMAAKIGHILVAIRDLDLSSRGALRKAASIAAASGARIELFHALEWPATSRFASYTADQRRRLEHLARIPVFAGLPVTAHIERDYPPHEAIVRRALATKADLVIAPVQNPARGGRLLLRNTDWELIRQCPCPVLLAKSSRGYEKPKILVAVDPFHAHAKPANLDEALLRVGAGFARTLRGSLHAFHAYTPLVKLMPSSRNGRGLPLLVGIFGWALCNHSSKRS
jgi:nucleotide-binding universal stress UspA family protein